jgi:hypothetical protein
LERVQVDARRLAKGAVVRCMIINLERD